MKMANGADASSEDECTGTDFFPQLLAAKEQPFEIFEDCSSPYKQPVTDDFLIYEDTQEITVPKSVNKPNALKPRLSQENCPFDVPEEQAYPCGLSVVEEEFEQDTRDFRHDTASILAAISETDLSNFTGDFTGRRLNLDLNLFSRCLFQLVEDW